MKATLLLPASADSDLVARARGGDRDAYGQLVAQYQTLVTSIAYCIGGDFARSQEVAQDAFVSAWRQLASLEDPVKFKPWLCGIARNLARNSLRQQSRRPDRPAAPASTSADPLDESPGPHERAVSREESALVWVALARLPEIYREPLVLFYREHHSIARVAVALDLSEDAVKQRLARGRALLRDQVEDVIGRTLGCTTPGVLFTTAVVAALPAAAPWALASATSAAAGKIGAAAKAGFSLASLCSWLFAPLLLGLANIYLCARQALRFARSATERLFLKRLHGALGLLILLSNAGVFAVLGSTQLHLAGEFSPRTLSLLLFAWVWLLLAGFGVIFLWARRRFVDWARSIRLPPDAPRWRQRIWSGPDRAFAYRSKFSAFGLPLLDIRFGYSPEEPFVRGTACGWIAIGDVAHGLLLAIGGVAIGGIALGGLAVGGITLGAAAVGLVAFGGVAVGGIASGLVAFGYVATGSLIAFGFEIADGSVAVARHFARGFVFSAAGHLGDAAARHAFEASPAMRFLAATKYLLMFANTLVIPVLSLVGTNFFVRGNYGDISENPRRISLPDHFRPPGKIAGQFLASLVLGAAVVAAAIAGASHRLAREADAAVALAREKVARTVDRDEDRADARHELGRALAKADHPAEALAEYLWCFDTGMSALPRLAGIRTVKILGDIEELSAYYPPARTALIARRDRAEASVEAGSATRSAALDAVQLNRILGEERRSLALYDRLPPDNRFRRVIGFSLFEAFRKARRYGDAAKAEPESFVFQRWSLTQSTEARTRTRNFWPVVQQRLHDDNVRWLAEHLEVLAGAGQLAGARMLLAKARSYDDTEAAQASYRAALARANLPGLLDSNFSSVPAAP